MALVEMAVRLGKPGQKDSPGKVADQGPLGRFAIQKTGNPPLAQQQIPRQQILAGATAKMRRVGDQSGGDGSVAQNHIR
jgi:hypothetical protein